MKVFQNLEKRFYCVEIMTLRSVHKVLTKWPS